VGMLDRIEGRLDRLINTGFARAFKAELAPVEIVAALRRECDDTASASGRKRPVAANDYTVYLAPTDYDRLAGTADRLCAQLGEAVRAHVLDQRYVLVGEPAVRLQAADDLAVGVCEVRGQVTPGSRQSGPASAWIEVSGTRIPLRGRVTILGRGPEADVRLNDPGVSSRHAAIHLGTPAIIEDLGSTNGTVVDGYRRGRAELRSGSVIVLGGTSVTFYGG
jgi:hypothetical protein